MLQLRLVAAVLLLTVPGLATPGLESRQAAVNKAIEQTKRRQSAPAQPHLTRAASRNTAATAENNYNTGYGGRSENLDVERLNSLLRTLDKTWILPRVGAKEPVGSNFQYKKTCASIYKARHGACQQLGFGTMCFNYCFERAVVCAESTMETGEKLSFKCQDTSEASYCRQSATFDIFIAKYRKDAYKAKAYVHQMISRCFATAICNTQTGILNSTLIEEETVTEATTKLEERLEIPAVEEVNAMSRLKITRPAGGFQLPGRTRKPRPHEESALTTAKVSKQRKYKPTTALPVPPPEDVDEEQIAESIRLQTTRAPVRVTTQKTNIWDKFTVGQKGRATPKYIPFWQKLLTTPSPFSKAVVESAEKEDNAEAEEVWRRAQRVRVSSRTFKKMTLPTKVPRRPPTQPPTPPPAIAAESTTFSWPATEAESPEPDIEPEVQPKIVEPPRPISEELPDEVTTEEAVEPTTRPQPSTFAFFGAGRDLAFSTKPPKRAPVKHTFKPLPSSSSSAPTPPELAFMTTEPGTIIIRKPGDANSGEHVPGFWNKFQPGRWYQSIHYLTNTGR